MGKGEVEPNELASLKLNLDGLRDKLSEVEAETRVTKHAVANMQQNQQAIAARLDKFEEKIGGKLDKLSEKVGTINLSQQRSLGFAAGVGFVITACAAIILTLAKFLFSPTP